MAYNGDGNPGRSFNGIPITDEIPEPLTLSSAEIQRLREEYLRTCREQGNGHAPNGHNAVGTPAAAKPGASGANPPAAAKDAAPPAPKM